MINPFTKIKSNKSWLQFISNRYFIVSLFFIVWILFVDNYSLFAHRELDKEIDELEDNKEYYKQEIAKDKEQIKKLKNAWEIEKYAREKYYMKRDSEDIYIVEFEGDTID